MFLFLSSFLVILVWTVLALLELSGSKKKISMEENENLTEEANVEAVISTSTKECPFCCETIKAGASRCPFCGESMGQHLDSHLGRLLRWQEFKKKRSSNYLGWILYSWEWTFESVALRIKKLAFFEILDYASRASVLIAVIFWFAESGERDRQAQIQAWQVISFGEQIGGGVATIQALELLNCTNSSLWLCNPVSFEGIKLENVSLPKINLPDAILAGIILTRANLVGANLVGANLAGADLVGANLTEANLWDAKMTEANLTDATLWGANLENAFLWNANLAGADLFGANLTSATLTEADMVGTDLTDVNLENANLRYVTLENSTLVGANLAGANLVRANLTEADMVGADLTDVNLENANLVGTDLTDANLESANLVGALYNKATIWPVGFDPVTNGAILSEE